ncbi:PAS domain-containing sensor histidine kinase [Haloarchaeobius amylolyticus]|uniref:PAS domain-containing sensor histidine kinase n=1 Tax=Haloarchaeobius amylolyticus TaxID=1198296 RepID=UPI0022710C63|nr:PAS domain S-box protein [Haloarchaeobius amylolyticus]
MIPRSPGDPDAVPASVLTVTDSGLGEALAAADHEWDVRLTRAASLDEALDELAGGTEFDCLVVDWADFERAPDELTAFARSHTGPNLLVVVEGLTGEVVERVEDDSTVEFFPADGPLALLVNRLRLLARARRYEARLREEQTFTRTALDAVSDLFYVLEEDGTLSYWNEQANRVTGYDDAELAGRHVTDLVTESDAVRIEDGLDRVRDGRTVTIRATLERADGREVPYEFTGAPLVVEGEFAGICGIGRDVRGRERRLEQLRRNHRRFEAVFDDPVAFMGLLSPEGELIDVNERALEFVDVARREVTGRRFSTLPWWQHSEPEQERVTRAVERAAAGEFVRFKATNRGSDDELIYLDCSLRPVVDDDGTVLSIVAEGIDITEQVLATRERELLLETIQAAAQATTFENALEQTIERVVETTDMVYGEAWVATDDTLSLADSWYGATEAATAFGERSETVEFERGEGLPGRVWTAREPEWLVDLSTEGERPFLRSRLAAAGELASAVGIPILGEDERPVAVLVFMTDRRTDRDERFLKLLRSISTHLGVVLQRRLAQDDLEAERNRLDRILATSPVGIIVVGPDGYVIRENRRSREMLGIDPDGSITEAYETQSWLVTDEDGEPIAQEDLLFPSVRRTGEPVFNEVRIVTRPSGERQWLLVNAAPVDISAGSEVVISFTDITAQKERQRALQNQAERVSVLNRVLRHDLRTNLTIIGGVLDLIEERDEVRPDDVETIRHAIDHLDEVSKQARDIEQAFERSGRVTVEVDELVEKAAAAAREQHPSATVVVDGEAVPPVSTHVRFRLALDQVLDNAVTHSESGSPTVRVAIEQVDDAHVAVTVSDDGPGIPEAEVAVLESMEETPLEHSNGLGLWFVHWLVARSGGELDIWNDDGAHVRMTLPVASATEDGAAGGRSVSDSETEEDAEADD